MNKKILVTGGAGFIGSHITELLCNLGYQVLVVDDFSFGYKEFVDRRARCIHGSIADENLMDKALDGVLAVIHLAASSIIKISYKKPLEYFENNLLNGVRLLESMRRRKVKRIINSSSAAVYGEPKHSPVKEDDLKNPITPYGASKLAFEQCLISYYHSFGIESVSLRYFNAYGPRDKQKPETRAVPVWIRAILQDKPIPLYWHGKQLRDYVYVKDIAKAHIDVLDLSGLHFFNIGSGNGVVMLDIINMIEKITNKKAKIKHMGKRIGDPNKLVADISKIRKKVGWKPETNFLDGLKETVLYYRSLLRR